MGHEVLSNRSNNGLDFIGVDDSRDISIGQDGSFQLEVGFEVSGLSERSENRIQSLTSRGSPDDKST